MGLNVWEVLDAAFTKPFGIMPFYPGPGVGGALHPPRPATTSPGSLREYGYSAQLHRRRRTRSTRTCPTSCVQKVSDALNERRPARSRARGSCVLGVAYKADVADTRESPSLEVFKQLVARGGDVRYCDPHIPALDLDGEPYTSVEWTEDEVREADCVVMLTQHREFLDTPRWDQAKLVVDTRNVAPAADHVIKI